MDTSEAFQCSLTSMPVMRMRMKTIRPAVPSGVTLQRRANVSPPMLKIRLLPVLNSATFGSEAKVKRKNSYTKKKFLEQVS